MRRRCARNLPGPAPPGFLDPVTDSGADHIVEPGSSEDQQYAPDNQRHRAMTLRLAGQLTTRPMIVQTGSGRKTCPSEARSSATQPGQRSSSRNRIWALSGIVKRPPAFPGGQGLILAGVVAADQAIDLIRKVSPVSQRVLHVSGRQPDILSHDGGRALVLVVL